MVNNGPVAVALGGSVPFSNNTLGPVGSNISHTAGSGNITLQPGVYYVSYSGSPVDGNTANVNCGVQLSLNGTLIPGTDSYVPGNDLVGNAQTLVGSGLVNVTAANSTLNLTAVGGATTFSDVVGLSIFKIA